MTRILRALAKSAGLVLYLLGGLVPRDRGLWVFGSWHGRRFADNAKWLFAHVARGEPEVRAVWISRDPAIVAELRSLGYEAHPALSPRGIWTCLRAGVYAYDVNVGDVNFYTSCGAFRANLWHGTPLKRIERDIDTPGHPAHREFHGSWLRRAFYHLRAPWNARSPDLTIAASPYAAPHMASAFAVPAERAPVTGLPRNDVLLSDEESPFPADAAWRERLLAWRAQGRRVLVYMPTFRDTKADRSLPLDWDRLEAFLAERGAVMLLKLHPHDAARLPDLARRASFEVVDTGADPYPILRHADVLVTDYSSVFFDFLALDRPMVFYAYDLEQYRSSDRSLYLAYEEATPGHHAATFDGLLAVLDLALQDRRTGTDRGVPSRREAMPRFAPLRDARSAERIVQVIRARVRGESRSRGASPAAAGGVGPLAAARQP
jgi:CDP-glycerol glycerophosphotransferase (TagB/SpsB family)